MHNYIAILNIQLIIAIVYYYFYYYWHISDSIVVGLKLNVVDRGREIKRLGFM